MNLVHITTNKIPIKIRKAIYIYKLQRYIYFYYYQKKELNEYNEIYYIFFEIILSFAK